LARLHGKAGVLAAIKDGVGELEKFVFNGLFLHSD
jgi:hypothetical protein